MLPVLARCLIGVRLSTCHPFCRSQASKASCLTAWHSASRRPSPRAKTVVIVVCGSGRHLLVSASSAPNFAMSPHPGAVPMAIQRPMSPPLSRALRERLWTLRWHEGVRDRPAAANGKHDGRRARTALDAVLEPHADLQVGITE